jgi:putative membrane protein
MEPQVMGFSANMMEAGMTHFFWGDMWMFPVGMLIVMLIMAFVVCGGGARRLWHAAYGIRAGGSRETPLEILQRRYATGEITKEEFERIRNDLRGESAA